MKKLAIYLVCSFVLFIGTCYNSYAQIVKTITVKVVNGSTLQPIEGALVTYHGIIPQQRETNSGGIAIFKIMLLLTKLDVEIEVNAGRFNYGSFKTTVHMSEAQNNYEVLAKLQTGKWMFNVNVNDVADGKALSGATVIVKANVKNNTGVTDAGGNAQIEIDQLLSTGITSLKVEVQKEGYKTKTTDVGVDPNTNNYSVPIALERATETSQLRVTVTDEKGYGIGDARIYAEGESITSLSNGTTDQSGVATLLCKGGGKYTVTAFHSNFESSQGEVVFNKYGDQELYTIGLIMKRKKSLLRNLTVLVIDEQTNQPVLNASVRTNVGEDITHSEGTVQFKNVVALGETGAIDVSAANYAPAHLNYVGGGDNFRYSPPPDDNITIRLKKVRSYQFDVIVEVLDYATQRPIGKATVTIKNKNGVLLLPGNLTNAKGEAKGTIKGTELDNTPLRVMAKATGYEENWSDMTAEFLKSENNPIVFTISLKQKKASVQNEEKKYGPFSVPSSNWVSTGIAFKKGDYFRIEASGAFKTLEGGQVGPEGGGYWTWWTLQGRIGKKFWYLSRSGSGTVEEDGILELGTPRGNGSDVFEPGDIKNLAGALTVYVFSKVGVQEKVTSSNNKYTQARAHIDFLNRVKDRDPALGVKDNAEVAGQLRAICSIYNLTGSCDECSYLNNPRRWQQMTPNGEKEAKDCLIQIIQQIEEKIRAKSL